MISIGLRSAYVVRKLVVRMSSTKLSYEDAVRKLNSLQSNKSTIEQIRREIRTGQKCTNIEDMENYLSRTGVLMSNLDQLSVIHVAGTKGKGSTSAMCESILRHHGYRTGFYSSPHLIAVRERIRLNGQVISEELFAEYFHQVYDMLDATKEYEGDMPKYFAFLTVLAFNVYLKEKVDVAIVEVGIGGIVDYTNVLRKVPIVGITALGLDHTSILGTTLPEIAAAKAGIMKPGCEAYTVAQPVDAMTVLTEVADRVKCPLHIAPSFETYGIQNNARIPTNLEAYQINASLAIQLAHAWMRKRNEQAVRKLNGFNSYVPKGQNGLKGNGIVLQRNVSKETVDGLKNCKWPGRYHLVESNYGRFYLDGAHTKESMEICAKWFIDNNRHTNKILIFSATGDRNAKILLKPLSSIAFKAVYFVIPTAFKETSQKNDNYSVVEQEELMARCQTHREIWNELGSGGVTVLQCVSDALTEIKSTGRDCSVLVTGSLHLVGAALSILDPNLSS